MPSLIVQIATGPGKTRREVFTDPVISFGRGGDNAIVLAASTASRKHGELRFEDGRWLLVNLSPNGTRVNGRNVTRRPHTLRDRDMVAIGDQPVFQITFENTPEVAADGAAATPSKPPMARSSRIGIGIGIWLCVCAAGFVFLYTLKSNSGGQQGPPKELTAQQIRNAVTAPIKMEAADPRKMRQELEIATEQYNKLDSELGNTYRAYEAFQLALASSGRSDLEGLDQLRYHQVQDTLVEQVTRFYREGCNSLRAGNYRDAEAAFHKAQEVYPVVDSPIYKNIELQRAAASAGLKRKKQ